MKYALIIVSFLLISCEKVEFVRDNNENTYLACITKKAAKNKKRIRNVIIDFENKSVLSEKYSVSTTYYKVYQYGEEFSLRDSYDKKEYRWGDNDGDGITRSYTLNRTSLELEVLQKHVIAGKEYLDLYNYNCEVRSSYDDFLRWEESIQKELDLEAKKMIKEKLQEEKSRKI